MSSILRASRYFTKQIQPICLSNLFGPSVSIPNLGASSFLYLEAISWLPIRPSPGFLYIYCAVNSGWVEYDCLGVQRHCEFLLASWSSQTTVPTGNVPSSERGSGGLIDTDSFLLPFGLIPRYIAIFGYPILVGHQYSVSGFRTPGDPYPFIASRECWSPYMDQRHMRHGYGGGKGR